MVFGCLRDSCKRLSLFLGGRNMINSVNVPLQTVVSGANVLFNVDRIRTNSCKGCNGWLHHDLGSGQFEISKCGIYEISYNANITTASASVGYLELEKNGEPIGGTRAIHQTVAETVGALGNVSATTLVHIPCGGSATITLGNNSTASLLIEDANIVIKKVA